MSPFDFLAAGPNTAFAVAGTVVLLILLLELLGLLVGLSPGGFLDDLLPEPPEAGEHAGLLAEGLGWLNAGRLPGLVLLLLLLGSFAAAGYLLQGIALSATDALAEGWVMALPAAVAAGFATRGLGRLVARALPQDRNDAISLDSLVGRLAQVTIGPVTAETPGRATLRDGHGVLHNLRIQAARPGESFPAGEEVLLAGRDGPLFVAVRPPAALAEATQQETGKGAPPA